MKLIIQPSIVKVIFDNEFQQKELKELLTVQIPGARYTAAYRNKQWDGKKSLYDRCKQTFPIGFLQEVINIFNIKSQDVIDKRGYASIDFCIPRLKGIELRLYQREALYYAYEFRNCLIQAATNAGKSAIIAALIKLLYSEKIVILVHRVELLWQLRKMLTSWTGMNIGYITAEEVSIDKYVNIAMNMTLSNKIDLDDEITDMFVNSKVVIVDECHRIKGNTYQGLLKRSQAVYRYGFSGTIPDDKTYDGRLVRQYIGDIVFNISNKELIEQGVSAEPRVIMKRYEHVVNYDDIIRDIKLRESNQERHTTSWHQQEIIHRMVFQEVLRQCIIENEDRNRCIVEEVYEKHKDKQILVVVDYLRHGELLYNMMWEKGKGGVDFIHGMSETRVGSLQKFREGKLRVLISSSIIDEGIDIDKIQVLVLVGGKKSKRQILQRIGRGLRRKRGENVVTIIDFYDIDGKYLERHSKERLKLYKKEKFEVNIV